MTFISTVEIESEWQACFFVVEDSFARQNHFFGEGELLAVQNQGIFVLSEVFLSIRTRLLQVFCLTDDVFVSISKQLHAGNNIFLVRVDLLVLRLDDLVELADVNG